MNTQPEIIDGGPAFPRLYARSDEDGRSGMALRDWFAGQALSGMSFRPDYSFGPNDEDVATRAYAIADAMLYARTAHLKSDAS